MIVFISANPTRLFVLFVAMALTSATVRADQPREEPAAKNGKMEVRFTDNSVMKLSIKDDWIAITTPYGKLTIPVVDIQRIDVGLRIPDDAAKRIEAAVADLGSTEFKKREAASAILLVFREKGYPAIVKASKSMDAEVANRAEELIKKLNETVPAELLKTRDFDVIYTESSKISGRIETATLKADSIQFGEVQIKLADVFVVSVKSTAPQPDNTNVAAGPNDLQQYQQRIGQTFSFKVFGQGAGSLWGTDVYTTDSTLGMAAVHAGLLQVGETGVIKVTIVQSPMLFVGSTRNGVTSQPYQQFPAAYRISK
jgi:hypothetical protein